MQILPLASLTCWWPNMFMYKTLPIYHVIRYYRVMLLTPCSSRVCNMPNVATEKYMRQKTILLMLCVRSSIRSLLSPLSSCHLRDQTVAVHLCITLACYEFWMYQFVSEARKRRKFFSNSSLGWRHMYTTYVHPMLSRAHRIELYLMQYLMYHIVLGWWWSILQDHATPSYHIREVGHNSTWQQVAPPRQIEELGT